MDPKVFCDAYSGTCITPAPITPTPTVGTPTSAPPAEANSLPVTGGELVLLTLVAICVILAGLAMVGLGKQQ